MSQRKRIVGSFVEAAAGGVSHQPNTLVFPSLRGDGGMYLIIIGRSNLYTKLLYRDPVETTFRPVGQIDLPKELDDRELVRRFKTMLMEEAMRA